MANPKLGVDLAGLDLRSTLQGDLALAADRENVRSAMMRRLDTPLGGLFSHSEYGNPVHDLLSEPIDATFEGRATAGIRQCLSQEPRIEMKNVEVTVVPEQRKAVFDITYSILNEPGVDNLVWEVTLQ
ncbi:MAG TPA: GPW/gp25 family protein [Syntrophomonadaceae bacterium]|nr:GPW/gp25 family protein [Syntrophomonadaceae bacterium]